jgi:protein-S-isoprenylcysteine O-methyltransferase Ste14
VLELGLRARELAQHRGGGGRDQATRILIVVTLGAALVLASVLASAAPSLHIPGPSQAVGLAVMWLGLAIRVWAIAVLGRAFRTTVEVDPGQRVVTDGPYAWVRHPSYTGLLLIVSGFGLARGNWLALAVCVVLPLPAVLRRIRVEEAELTRVLGGPYRVYQTRTKRLIPGVW